MSEAIASTSNKTKVIYFGVASLIITSCLLAIYGQFQPLAAWWLLILSLLPIVNLQNELNKFIKGFVLSFEIALKNLIFLVFLILSYSIIL